MGWWNIPVVRHEMGDPWSGLGRVGETSRRSGTGWGTFREVRDGSGKSCGGQELVG